MGESSNLYRLTTQRDKINVWISGLVKTNAKTFLLHKMNNQMRMLLHYCLAKVVAELFADW